jgi:hypothetical protein
MSRPMRLKYVRYYTNLKLLQYTIFKSLFEDKEQHQSGSDNIVKLKLKLALCGRN